MSEITPKNFFEAGSIIELNGKINNIIETISRIDERTIIMSNEIKDTKERIENIENEIHNPEIQNAFNVLLKKSNDEEEAGYESLKKLLQNRAKRQSTNKFILRFFLQKGLDKLAWILSGGGLLMLIQHFVNRAQK